MFVPHRIKVAVSFDMINSCSKNTAPGSVNVETESDKLAQQVQEDAHPAAASTASQAPAKASSVRPKAK